MAEIREFCALRFTASAGEIGQLVCPPYDIISKAEREEYLRKNANNIIKLESPEQTPEGYSGAKVELDRRIANGIMAKDSTPALYIYEESFTVDGKLYSFRGVTAYVKLQEFSDGVILPHEHTLSKAKTDRLNLLKATGCSFSQIYSLYNDADGKIPALISELSAGAPDVEFTDADNVTHRMWIVEKSDKTAQLCALFGNKKLYIADGHHRYETALNYKKYMVETGDGNPNADYIMMFLVDMQNSGLVVFPTHRVIFGLESFDSAELLNKSEPYFTITEVTDDIENQLKQQYQRGNTAFGYFDGSKKYLFVLKNKQVLKDLLPNMGDALRELDVTVLHSLILEGILGIDKENLANQINLKYTRDTAEALSEVASGANACFILNPTRVSEIAAVAKAGDTMPQKSTYFYPKLITGLVVNQIK